MGKILEGSEIELHSGKLGKRRRHFIQVYLFYKKLLFLMLRNRPCWLVGRGFALPTSSLELLFFFFFGKKESPKIQ